MKKYITILVCFIFFFGFAQNKTYKVVGIIDGDTIEVLDVDSKLNFRIRLAEIDCPEKGQNFGTKAKEFTSNQVYKKIVKLDIIDTDRYGRYIAKVYYDNKYLSEELIKQGLAIVYRKYSSNQILIKLEQQAQKNKIGVWSDSNFINPEQFRKQKY